jgi:pyruvate dehydrogenase complex dehydrogenase (E1) component
MERADLRRGGLAVDRWNMLHSNEPRRQSYVEQQQQLLAGRPEVRRSLPPTT